MIFLKQLWKQKKQQMKRYKWYNKREQTKNGDAPWMVNATNPWLLRGGNQNNEANAGVFAFTNWYGNVNGNDSFRQTLITNKNEIICKVYF